MASVSASHLIIFIASILVAATVAGTITATVADMSQSLETQGVDVSDQIATDFAVITDAGAQVYDRDGAENVTLHVKNTGSRYLPDDASQIDVFVDGEYTTDVTVTIVDGTAWTPGSVARFDVAAPGLTTGDHRVKIVAGGHEEVFEFRL
ncbi:flagellar protein G [Halococcoides cellulosivorans]|uniref:Flagellar protein G n=1 Tax=Halococcoides cellulosivorans TaxID=1679096 RepID=A0A2R4X272_9EURY|nr:flagellar protein G [Halococcoides cellulosivorans]AWB27875.1 flagellar protein G [Halococcoides cellulosivorans]